MTTNIFVELSALIVTSATTMTCSFTSYQDTEIVSDPRTDYVLTFDPEDVNVETSVYKQIADQVKADQGISGDTNIIIFGQAIQAFRIVHPITPPVTFESATANGTILE